MILGLMVVAFKAGDLPLIGGGDTYKAAFSEGGGVKPNDEVRIAGVRVGKVTAVDLDGNKVIVTFKVDTPSKFGPDTEAEIKVKTLLGAMFVALKPEGAGQLKEGLDDPGVPDQGAVRRRRRPSRVSPTAPSGSTPTGWPTPSTPSPT